MVKILQAQRRHKTSPTATAALGRTILGTLLISSFKAEGETTQVQFVFDCQDICSFWMPYKPNSSTNSVGVEQEFLRLEL